ncbi:META domain-containing protein [Halarcobacter bivalviorum]|uniref:META domain-containing protein n=1 Tax=Halarcobacter bivalviorum TaxID=663364 RepID=A0AAX2A923_9BACT|nr:META domain-containing protein [Halarcobacter bivalviorum]AXH13343.1 META domain-containing protein [Halarcobacter bivalviorum]RXK10051.1 hypothetical protein CRV05_06655 [Halarcobacter bivalviorum]
MLNKIIFLGLFVVAIFFTACSNTTVEKVEIKPNVSLLNTYWKVNSLYGKEVEVFVKEAHLKFKDNNQVNGALGCNNFFGKFEQKDSSLSFINVASTKMMCPNMKTEDAFSKVLFETRTYKISGETMTFFNENKEEIAKFKAVYF